MLYKHKNTKFGIITIHDSKGKGYELKPGDEVTIDRNSAGNGVIVIEELSDSGKRQNPTAVKLPKEVEQVGAEEKEIEEKEIKKPKRRDRE